jgi:hypothetical protein
MNEVKDYSLKSHIKLPALSPKVFCKNCDIYEDRIKIARQINAFTNTVGYWDFAVCYRACKKRKLK